MQTGYSYEQFGGIFLERPELHVFMNHRRGPLERQCKIIYADTDRLGELWGKGGEQFSRPPHIDEWEDDLRRTTTWRLLKGPRHPIEVPYIYHNGDCFVTGSSEHHLEALLDWEAKIIPIMIRHQYVDQVKAAAGTKDSPVIEAAEFLSDNREAIVAFQNSIPLAQLYAGRKAPDEKQIRKDAENYAILINIQLETLLLRHHLYQRNMTAVTDEQREALVEEVRHLLFQKGIIAHFLSHETTLSKMPSWDSGDVESRITAMRFLADNPINLNRQRPAHLRVVSTDASKLAGERPQRPSGGATHLRVTHKPEDSL